jgi:hypothetical protein
MILERILSMMLGGAACYSGIFYLVPSFIVWSKSLRHQSWLEVHLFTINHGTKYISYYHSWHKVNLYAINHGMAYIFLLSIMAWSTSLCSQSCHGVNLCAVIHGVEYISLPSHNLTLG